MKKLSLLLALLMILSCCLLASCGSDDTEASEADSAAAESEEETKEESKEEPVASETSAEESSEEPVEESSEASVEASDEQPTGVKREGKNLALNCNVTGADMPNSNELQTYSAKLTDGVAAGAVTFTADWFGYYYQPDPQYAERNNTVNGVGVATVDLGAVKTIKEICTNVALGNNAGIPSPKEITFEYSEDGKNFTNAGTLKYKTPESGTDLVATWVGVALDSVSARYVRVSYKAAGVWTFVNEIEVY